MGLLALIAVLAQLSQDTLPATIALELVVEGSSRPGETGTGILFILLILFILSLFRLASSNERTCRTG